MKKTTTIESAFARLGTTVSGRLHKFVSFFGALGHRTKFCLMAIPASIICAGFVGAWHWITGQDVLTGALGGALGIIWAFLLIIALDWLIWGKN